MTGFGRGYIPITHKRSCSGKHGKEHTIMKTLTFPKLALGTWSWGSGWRGGDVIFGNHLELEDL